MDKKPVKALPIPPPLSSTSSPSAGRTSTSSRPPNEDSQLQQQPQRPSTSSSSSNDNGRLSMQASRRSSAIPRPAPIPLPQPVSIPINNVQSSLESSGAGDDHNPSSTSSTGSALASVSAELVQPRPPPRPPRHHSNNDSNSVSPTSPKETSTLLDQQQSSSTPRSSSSPHVPTTSTNNGVTKVTILGSSTITTSPPSVTPRPRSAVDSGSARASSAGGGTTTNEFGAVTRPYSSADTYARPSSSHSLSGDGSSSTPHHAHTVNNGGARSQSPSADSLLKASTLGAVPRSRSTNFIGTPSPLNPNASSISPTPIPRPYSTATNGGGGGSRPASMVLYRLAGVGDDNPQMSSLSPPVTLNNNSRRASRFSTLSSSSYSIFGDSKYPVPAGEDGTLTPPPQGVFLAYEYDPSWDQDLPDDEEDELHKPDEPGKATRGALWSTRGALNICVMVTILVALVFLFALYPVISHFDSKARAGLFTGTDHSNNPGGGGDGLNNSYTRTSDQLIDPDTPDDVKTKRGFDGTRYNLVFSDEFKMEGRTFKPRGDPFWEAVDLFDLKNSDLNWYDTEHVTTKGGHMVITMENKPTNGYQYVSGMVQSWNKFCFTGGYIEVAVSLPGTNQVFGFTPQVYTMGNLARSGYPATEDGVLMYSYNFCDDGVAPNQQGSALTGQRLSACTCDPSSREYPGPNQAGTNGHSKGRGAPQIDVLGYLDEGQDVGVISQSMRFAPLAEGRLVQGGQSIRSATDSRLNTYTGSANGQVISALTNVDAGSYTEGGAQFTAFGYEHIINANDATSSSLHWFKGDTEVYRVTGEALAADAAGSVSQRLISEEPMYIVLSLALSQAVTAVTPTSLTFPAQFLIDYVRVYQPEGQDTKVTCDPTDFPTADYISNHQRAYDDATQTNWATLYDIPASSYRQECGF